MTTTTTTYRVTATAKGEDQTSAEVLGEAYGRTYATREEAELAADNLDANAETAFPGAGLTYSVVEA